MAKLPAAGLSLAAAALLMLGTGLLSGLWRQTPKPDQGRGRRGPRTSMERSRGLSEDALGDWRKISYQMTPD